jgi:glucan phosphoethanolaminetransferase (alkaline phosphatase superfamily)
MIPSLLTKTSTTKSGKKVTHLAWWVTLVASLALSIGTWNPTEHHFINYLLHVEDLFSGFKPFLILMMFAFWLLAIKSIFQSLGLYGAGIVMIIIGAFIWGLQYYGIINVTDLKQAGWAATIAVGVLIWFGLNASIIWKKLTGVYTTDSSNEDN